MHQHALQKTLKIAFPELLKRYGMEPGDYIRPQIAATVAALKMSEETLPYLYATFLTEAEYKAIQSELPAVAWPEIEREAQTAYDAIQHAGSQSDHFYESWKGVNGA